MEHKNKEKLDWIIASNIDKGINLQTVYGTYLEIRELLQKKINECRKKDVVHYKDAFFEFQDQKIQATVTGTAGSRWNSSLCQIKNSRTA